MKRSIINSIHFILILPALTGVLFGLAALPSKLFFLNFIGFIPLLIASDWTLSQKKIFWNFLLQLLIAIVVFYSWGYFWVLKTAHLGFLLGYIGIAPFLVLVSPYIFLRKRNNKFAFVYFIAAWLTAELAQSYFKLGSPFFNLGHNPGACPELIQWYSITGAAGGSLWILAGNFALLSLGNALVRNRKRWIPKAAIAAGIIIVPMLLSLLIFYTYREKGTPVEVLIVHPSTDNRDVKYQKNIYELMDIYLGIMKPGLTENTEYVVLPETAITNAGWVKDLNNNLVFDHFHEQTRDYPKLKLVTGAVAYEAIPDVEKIKGYRRMPGIRHSEKYQTWYYTYNSAVHLEQGAPVQMRVKEGLVPYQEYAPYPRILPRLAPVGIDFQFSSREPNRQVFTSQSRRKTAALICYELVYGRMFRKAAREGAEAFFVLLNEGWYLDAKHVPEQFLQLSVIRAIENRRCIAHSSNLGISAFISQKGEIVERMDSKSSGFLRQEMKLTKQNTIVARLGNYTGIIAIIAMILITLIELMKKNKITNK